MKPILFNTEMVMAILDGRKTVTRRVVKPQPRGDGSAPEPLITRPGYWNAWSDDFVYHQPYQPGDILYVRETFFAYKGKYNYKADGKHHALNAIIGGKEFFKWHPSIHMPKEAARLFLRVKDVRVERLWDAFSAHGSTIFSLLAEGVDIGEQCRECIKTYGNPCCIDGESECGMLDDIRADFADNIWDKTIPRHPNKFKMYRFYWRDNPWVWVIEFERISKEEALQHE